MTIRFYLKPTEWSGIAMTAAVQITACLSSSVRRRIRTRPCGNMSLK